MLSRAATTATSERVAKPLQAEGCVRTPPTVRFRGLDNIYEARSSVRWQTTKIAAATIRNGATSHARTIISSMGFNLLPYVRCKPIRGKVAPRSSISFQTVMNLLLESTNAVPYFTDVGGTLRALGVDASEFDWYVSDIETNVIFDGPPQTDGWVTGPELARCLMYSNLQFIWGVFNAFPRGKRVEVLRPPAADGNTRFWRDADALTPQLEGALFELVCWDSAATILVGITPEQAAHYMATHPEAKLLRDAA